jgi:dihydroorotate dehydrogenase (NAD+) catalytic subunit
MKYDLVFDPPVMNAAGSLGFAAEAHGWIDLSGFGAFVTNPVSLHARRPAESACCIDFPGGFLLHTGFPNPGIRAVRERFAAHWANAPFPIIVHLLCGAPQEVGQMAALLEDTPGVVGIELGLPLMVGGEEMLALVQAAMGELPVILRLPLERSTELVYFLSEAGANIPVSFAPPRGVLPLSANRLVHGRLYGPGVFPQALAAVRLACRLGLTVIGAGGVYTAQHTQAMLAAGAIGVQLDAILWRGGYRLSEKDITARSGS